MFKLVIVLLAALFAISMAAPEPEAAPQYHHYGLGYPYSAIHGYHGYGYHGYPYGYHNYPYSHYYGY